MAIELAPLPFAPGSLAPHISRKTIDFHYGKHHRKYVQTLNELIEGTPLDKLELDEILSQTLEQKPKIYNPAAQAWNHEFYWNCLTPEPKPPSAEVKKAISKEWGSVPEFRAEFVAKGKELFGSGWVWLTKNRRGRLQVRGLPDAQSPLQLGETPLLTCDVWEHAYYLDYQNERDQYLERFWSVMNWSFVEANLALPTKRRKLEPATRSSPRRNALPLSVPDPTSPILLL